MFKKLFGNSTTTLAQSSEPTTSPRPPEPAKSAGLEPQGQTDPLAGAKAGGKEVLRLLLVGMKSERGVHIESLLCALGALAGYACQANLRTQATAKGMNPDAPFQVVATKDGKKYYFGDPLNKTLAEGHLSVWSLVAGAAKRAGAQTLPDLKEIFARTSATLGSPQWGQLKYPEGHAAGDAPINYLKTLWPKLLPIVTKLAGQPMLWPTVYAFAIQETIQLAKNTIEPGLALLIVMEAAIPMSKVNLDES
ncbi:hypothetical protein [Nevskia soli]|uniref:hypothetical protein n=1 Tax=Nevskia soli TaxID=418856 RepID=UPI0012F8E994|nr:hypothetical protein [Nevskia soli]